MSGRFIAGTNNTRTEALVIDISASEFNDLSVEKRAKHKLVRIQIGGMVSEELARTWTDQIAAQLNQFDVANATVAKLT